MMIQDKELRISKLTLGTVQLGMEYGIANKNGKPNQEESLELLRKALESGVISLDTARHYGSEEVIGLSGLAKEFIIVSKFKLEKEQLYNEQASMDAARSSILKSCEALNINKLSVCLFHQDKDYPVEIVAQRLPVLLKQLKEEGLIDVGGISVYHPDELNAIKDWDVIKAVQVPMNVFDLRLLKHGLLQRLRENGVAVFIRSVFLQGLLLMDPEALPEHLKDARVYLRQLNKLVSASGLSTAQLACSYIRDTEGVSSLVIGAESIDQVIQNAALLKGPALSEEIRASITVLFSDMPEKLITPGLWAV